ncbi:MAG TPA: ABC transporter permease [Beijerinckiaceae bacterium]|nr:ABC transporter permease [Beijerinckiaceae bacterium]
MNELGRAFFVALDLVANFDSELASIVLLSLRVSLSATLLAFVIGAPLGAALAVSRFWGKGGVLVVVNAMLGLPPVVVGLIVYLLVSRSGPLGPLGLLFTPGAMVLAQTMLATPIVVALTHRFVAGLWAEYGDTLLMDGASRPRAIAVLLDMGRASLVTVALAAFGRAIAEVGAIIVVGGNIRGATRTMTTAIALETSKGDLPLALGLGVVLISLSLMVTAAAFTLEAHTTPARA